MPKEEWGVKRVCPNCSTRFYDLRQDPMTCPSCRHSVTVDVLMGGKQKPTPADKQSKTKKPELKEEEEDVLEVEDDDEVDLGDDVLEDEDDDTVDLDDIADVAADDDDT
ncbi:TIGR02300 family protein [Maritimibacter sp. 55A14]|uniref:TIGR02300 family protein n=1 Tax=Maritimibacter sp. 55A14 TaxID=2174844 RepID=UPI000D6045B1|nr:TIGR02300 family protein [Maritimibacter sp. 55A14]PWE29271.1 TIGR02300 family protein [Maritimibacter sp. 55A14]